MSEPLLPGPEIILGLVGAVGTDLARVEASLSAALAEVNYTVAPIRLSKILKEIVRPKPLRETPVNDRYNDYMDAGNDLRKKTGHGDAVAILSIEEIREFRRKSPLGAQNPDEPISRTAYILRSLKHPDEVIALRRIYGPGFLLIGAYSPRDRRLKDLEEQIAASYQQDVTEVHTRFAEDLMKKDEKDRVEKLGQNVRDTFPLSDVFVDAGRGESEIDKAIERFIKGLFRYQFHTPTRDEYGMFQARAAALRSAELGRQVGAAITTADGQIVAVGTNEVPAPGGGQYWPEHGEADHRDFQQGEDVSDRRKRTSLVEVLNQLKGAGWLKPEFEALDPSALLEQSLPLMQSTRLMNLIEFGRAVHAEMAAITDAARRGVSVQGCTLYTTTFPCHNCARHIVSSGISRLVYIEPYAKSLAPDLHEDAIALDSGQGLDKRVRFEPFVGIAPQLYMNFFTMILRKHADGTRVVWEPRVAAPRMFPPHKNYLQSETSEGSKFAEVLSTLGIELE